MPSSQFDLVLALRSQGATQVASEIKSVGANATQMGNATSQSFAKVTTTSQGMNSQLTTTRNIMGANVTTITNTSKATTGWTSVLKNNVLAIGTVAAGVIGLVSQYTSLQKAQIMVNRAEIIAETSRNRVIDLTNKLALQIEKYGQNSTQAAKAQRDLSAAQEKSNLNTQRADILQTQFNERLAEFATNLLPTIISTGSGVIQVIQGFRGAQQAAAEVTTITGEAIAVQNAQMALAKGGAGALAVANEGLAASEIATGEAATVAGTAMRTALIRTGIGAILVALGTALVAFTQNWWGFRDAVNSAGVAIGKFLPGLTPVLNMLQQVGVWMNSIFGTEIPQSADAASTAIEGVGAAGTKAAEESKKAADDIAKSWSDIFKSIDISAFSGKSKFKDQFKFISELGFGKSGVHKIKFALELADTQQSLFSKISKSLGIIKTFHLPASDQRKWANNIIDDMTKAIKDEPALKNILQPLVDIIKNNKKSANLGPLVAQYFDSLPEDVKAVLAANQIDIPGLIKNMGLTPEAIHAGIKASFQTPAFTNAIGDISGFLSGEGSGGGGKTTAIGTTTGTSFATNFVAGVQSQATQVATALDKVITDSAKGWDIIFQLAGIKEAAMFSQGWKSFKEFGSQVFTWIASNIGPIGQEILGLGTGAAAWFTEGWKAFTDFDHMMDQWVAAALPGLIPTLKGIGAGAAAYFSIGWKTLTTLGSDVVTWVNTQLGPKLTEFFNTGAQVGGKILDGIKSAFGGIGAGAQGLWQWILDNNPFKIQGAEAGGPTTDTSGNGGGFSGFQGGGLDFGESSSSTDQQTAANNLLARTVVQLTKDISALVTQNNILAKTIVQVAKDVGAWVSSNNVLARTIITVGKDVEAWIKDNNTLAKTIVTTTKDVTAWIKADNTLARTIVQLDKDEKALVKTNNTLARTIVTVGQDMKSAAGNASSLASKLNGVASAANKAASAIRKIPNAPSSSNLQSVATGGIFRSFAPGGIVTTHGPQLAVFGDNPGGVETHAFIPHNDPAPTLMNLMRMFIGGNGGGGGQGPQEIVINNYTKLEGNGIINDRVWESKTRAVVGKGIRKML